MNAIPGQAAAWSPLRLLDAQFRANLAALDSRYPRLAAELAEMPPISAFVRTSGDMLQIGEPSDGDAIITLPNPVTAAIGTAVVARLFPENQCTQPVLVAGLDQGWLWMKLQAMPVSTPAAPGHRPPLYFLCEDLHRLRVVLHLHDWRSLLSDSRVRLFCGADAIVQLKHEAADMPQVPLPRLSVTINPELWPAGETLDTVLRDVQLEWEGRFGMLRRQVEQLDASFDSDRLATRIRCGEPLRILGFTSRFTTFLQYSMRDWLEGLRSLGHETSLLMEAADHETISAVAIAAECSRFKPDMILAIDHFRAELAGMPQAMPCVMWVQDRLPNIFNSTAGAAQQRTDYVIGQGRTDCVRAFGYPSSRFMPAMIGTNPSRFAADPSTDEPFDCDVAFISHCSAPAERVLEAEIARLNSPHATRLLRAVFDQLRAIYDAGGSITQQYKIERVIRQTLLDTKTTVPDIQPLVDLFTHRINNAMYRHQAIEWVADMDVTLRLYGRGWEDHPRFARYAAGIADNERQLAGIYRRSRINLQVTPFGAAHQRLFDGLAAGGFFLMRRTTGDRFDQLLRRLWTWCESQGINDDAMLLSRADDNVRDWLAELDLIDGKPVMGRGYEFVAEMAATADEGFIRSAGTIWPEFGDVSFDSRQEVQEQMSRYLGDSAARRRLTDSMRQRVLESLTYRAVSERMLRFIAADLGSMIAQRAA